MALVVVVGAVVQRLLAKQVCNGSIDKTNVGAQFKTMDTV